MNIDTLAIVGLGLIGGSVARAARQRAIGRRLVGVEINGAQRGVASRLVDLVVGDYLHPDVVAADVVVVCTPVDRIADQVISLAGRCRSDALLTDVGSTKAVIVDRVECAVPHGTQFVGSHPLAGSEKQGAQHADPDLFCGRLCVVTPTERTPAEAVNRVISFWQALGANVRRMTPADHDRAVAVTSHLPHLVASALAGVLPAHLDDLTATGFRDTTRLAASQPELWSAIFQQNSAAILDALSKMQERVGVFREALESQDMEGLHRLLVEGKQVKDRLADKRQGSGNG